MERILLDGGRAAGVDGWCGLHRITVRAPRVIVAGGAIESPALLLRSGLHNPNIGQHLRMHPGVFTAGLYPEPVEPWSGRMMPGFCNHFVDPETRVGFLIVIVTAHPGLAALATPWTGGRRFKNLMLQLRHVAPFEAMIRDQGAGRVTVDRRGRARVAYWLDARDQEEAVRALQAMVRIHAAAGAQEVVVMHTDDISIRGDAAPLDRARIERFVRSLETIDTRPNRLTVFSSHQTGSCRMGRSPQAAVTDPRGRVFGVAGVYVCDGSLCPSAPGVNPMVTIMSLATWVARHID
ncbi:MAG: GMC family oxidoreductase [Armatimonadetes bacterium]|nr:GMC family oxidoreductase [Armatimonadota bacterium]